MWTRIIALIVLLLAATARAGSVIDRVPDDAIAFVVWRGADLLQTPMQGTHLRKVLDHSDIPALVDDCLPQVLNKIGVLAPQSADVMNLIHEAGPPLWHHASAIYWAGMKKDGTPRAALICQAETDADQVEKTFTSMVAMAQEPGLLVGRDGQYVIVSIGYDKATDALAGPTGGKTLLDQPKFKTAMAQVNAGDGTALLAYIDGQAAIAAIPTDSDKDKKQKDRFMALWGFDGWQSTALAVGFDGKDWSGKIFVDAPAPRKGLFAFFDKAVDENILKVVPSSATSVFAGKFDAAQLFELVHQTAGIDSPQHNDFDDMIKQADQAIGMDIHDDLLANLGTDWVVYSDPQTAGTGPEGLVIANRPRDADKLGNSLTKLEAVANSAMAEAVDNPKVHVAIHERTINGLTLHYLATPLVTPTCAIKDGTLYVGLYPSVVYSAAIENPGDKSILDNLGFAALRDRLSGQPAAAISYIDLPAMAPDAYGGILALSRLPGAADIIGVTSPVTLIPKYKDLAPELAPAGMAVWSDNDGIHLASVEPFPGSGLFSLNAGALISPQSVTILPAILMPALTHARAQARNVQSASNLRQIDMCVMMYANDNKGKLPDSLGQLIDYGITPSMVVNPKTGQTAPHGLTKEQESEWIDEHSDYVWLGKGQKQMDIIQPTETVLIYEKPFGSMRGINAAFADGHVEFLTMDRAKEKIPNLPIDGVPTTQFEDRDPPHGGGL